MKKVLALILACLMALSLAACGGKTQGGTSGAANGTAGTSDAGASDSKGTDAASEPSGEKLVLRLGHVVADESSLDQGMDALAELIKERSNGLIEVELYPNSTLGDNTALAEQLQFGSLEMAVPSIAAVSGFSRATAIFDMPFLFKNNAAAEEALDGELGDHVAAALEESGFHVLGYFTQGLRHLTCNVEARNPSDMKGVKIRTMDSKYHMMCWNSYGASATPMAFSEVYTALQQHTIDAEENPYTNIVTSRFYEVQKYVVETGHIYDVCPLLFSKVLWDKLTPEQQTLIQECVEEALPIERQIVETNTETERGIVTESGNTEIIELTDAERQAFRDAASPCYEDYKANYGEEAEKLLAIVDGINAKH